MKPATQPKLTKRQRKALCINAAVNQSLKHGDRHTIAGVDYFGRKPEYSYNPLTKQWSKARPGIPFVRETPKAA